MNSAIRLKINLNQFDQKQSILEILEKLQGEIFLEFDCHQQNALIQIQNFIIDQQNIFHLNDQNQFQQDQLLHNQYFNEIIGISKKMKFIVIHNLMKNHFYQKAYLLQMKIFPDWNLSEYKTKQQLNSIQQHFLEQINYQINKIILLSAYCKNQIEKNCKINFLRKSLDKIANILETNQENLLLGEVEEPCEYARSLKKLIFILNLNENGPQIIDSNTLILQKQILLNSFIYENFRIQTHVISIIKPKCTRRELKEFTKELTKQNQNINIKVGYNRFDITSFKKVVYLEIELYDNRQNIDQSILQEIQDGASKILRLNIKERLNFENFICKLPLITNYNIKFKHYKSGIKLNNSFYQDKQFRDQVNEQLKQLKFQLLYLKVDFKLNIYFNQVGMEQKKQILTKLFMDVTQQKYILCINDIKFEYIEVMVYNNQILNNDIITLETILNETLAQLQITSFQMNQLNLLELTIEQFQQKYNALMYVEDQKLHFILHSKYVNQIKNLLDSFKTLTLLSFRPKSNLYAQQLFYDYKNKITEQSQEILSIKLSSNNEILYLECPTKNMTVVDIFIKYEQVLDQLLLEIPITISKMEAKFLYNNCQKEIQKVCQEQIFELNFNFNEYQTPGDSQNIKKYCKNITPKSQFIKFSTKEVNFDTNLKCDILMKFVSNQNFDWKISYQIEERVHPNALSIKEYFINYQKMKIPYKQIGVIYEDIKDIFPKLLRLFMSKDQTKFQELTIFIDNNKFKSQYEQELIMTLVTSIQYQDFQWQWQAGVQFNDYDDSMINEQIEIAYQAYRLNNKKNELFLKFPYSQEPGTHTIDLNKGTIVDHVNGLIQQIKSNNGLYQIGNEQADDILNQYIIKLNQSIYIHQKISMNQYQFTVYLKKYMIFFKTKDEIYQINQETKYKRKLRREVQTDKYFKFINEFIKQKLNVETKKQTPDADNMIYCKAQTFIKQNLEFQQATQNKIEEITNTLQKILEKYTTYFQIKLPVTNDQIYISFLNYLNNNTLQIDGELNQNQTMYIKSFEKYQKSIQEVVEFLQQIPQSWNTFSYQRLCYFDILQPDFEEVKQSFPFLNIKTIELIQNYDLWAKYQSIKRSLEGWNEELLLYGNQKYCFQEEIGRVTLSVSFDYHKGPYVKCGKTISYIKDNYCESQKGEKQIIIVQVLLGQPQNLKQQFVISDYAQNNYKEDDYYYIKRNRIYPKFLITLNEY